MTRSCPTCYQNSYPETPDITINQTIIQFDGANAAWYYEYFTRASPGYDSVSNTITLSRMPVSPSNVIFALNGGVQGQNSTGAMQNYTVSGNIIALNFTPISGDEIFVRYMAYSAELSSAFAVGSIIGYEGSIAPAGWVFLDGTTSLVIADYAALYSFASANSLILSETATNFVLVELLLNYTQAAAVVEGPGIIKT